MSDLLQIAYGLENRPLKIGTITISCFILNNNDFVIIKSAVQKALGYDGKSEHWLNDLLDHIHKFYPIDRIITAAENPIAFGLKRSDGSIQTTDGIVPKLFLDCCKVIVLAKKEGFLNVNQLKFAKSAENILAHLNETNINQLIAEATGYTFYVEGSIAHLEQFLTNLLVDPALVWTKTFPIAFFEQVFELHDLNWKGVKENPQNIGRIIHEIVFTHIPDELLYELRNKKPIRTYKRKGNKPQDNQHPELKIYILNVLSLIKASGYNWNIFLQLLGRSYPKNTTYTSKFPLVTASSIKEPLSDFNQSLRTMT